MDHDAAPWLDAEERRAFLALMSMAMRLEPTLDAQLRRDAGLTHFEYSVLANLSEADDGTRRMSELAWLSSGSLPRLSQVVTRLEKRGLVRREPDPDDGRSTRAVLTASGRSAVEGAAPGHVAEVRRVVLDPLTRAQVRQLAAIGRRVMGAIDPEDRSLPRGLSPHRVRGAVPSPPSACPPAGLPRPAGVPASPPARLLQSGHDTPHGRQRDGVS